MGEGGSLILTFTNFHDTLTCAVTFEKGHKFAVGKSKGMLVLFESGLYSVGYLSALDPPRGPGSSPKISMCGRGHIARDITRPERFHRTWRSLVD